MDGARRLDTENNAKVSANQIIGGIGEEGIAFMSSSPLHCRIGQPDETGQHTCAVTRQLRNVETLDLTEVAALLDIVSSDVDEEDVAEAVD